MGKRERKRIWNMAVEAARKAASEAKPTPMVVRQHAQVLDDSSPVVRQWAAPEGVCGFAWVRLKGNTAMGRFLKTEDIASAAYPSGLMISAYKIAPAVGQSLERAEAAVKAAVGVLRAHGIEAWSESRMD